MKELEEIAAKLKTKDIIGLREMSNKLIEDVFVSQEKKKVNAAIVAYALSKLLTKPHFVKSSYWLKFEEHVLEEMEKDVEPEKIIQDVIQDVINFDKNFGNYISDLIQHARTKQASRLYALGLSLSQACDLCNANKSEVLRYVGITKIHEREFTQSKTIQDRLKIAKKIFG